MFSSVQYVEAGWTEYRVNPLRVSNIGGTSSSDIFFVLKPKDYDHDPFDKIGHFDGSTLNIITTTEDIGCPMISSIWASSGVNVYALSGFDRIIHYDGSNWSESSTGASTDLYELWGSSPTDIFAVGRYQTIMHFDGNNWSLMSFSESKNSLVDIWGSSPTDVYAVGSPGIILHYDGNNWSPMSSGVTSNLSSIWGSSPSRSISFCIPITISI